ncbi:MAG: 4Fe-4S binding protein, partial [Bradymonadaceae bacterium]
WACPQTVYLEFVYRPIERLFEGRASQRKRRDEREATAGDVWRKIGKFTVYAIVSLALSHTFLAYFVGWSDLVAWMGDNPANHWGVFLAMAGTTALILFDFGYFREQMCTTVCPYARLQ